jgi:hypothetical protein
MTRAPGVSLGCVGALTNGQAQPGCTGRAVVRQRRRHLVVAVSLCEKLAEHRVHPRFCEGAWHKGQSTHGRPELNAVALKITVPFT